MGMIINYKPCGSVESSKPESVVLSTKKSIVPKRTSKSNSAGSTKSTIDTVKSTSTNKSQQPIVAPAVPSRVTLPSIEVRGTRLNTTNDFVPNNNNNDFHMSALLTSTTMIGADHSPTSTTLDVSRLIKSRPYQLSRVIVAAAATASTSPQSLDTNKNVGGDLALVSKS